jgi:hypothetical protein
MSTILKSVLQPKRLKERITLSHALSTLDNFELLKFNYVRLLVAAARSSSPLPIEVFQKSGDFHEISSHISIWLWTQISCFGTWFSGPKLYGRVHRIIAPTARDMQLEIERERERERERDSAAERRLRRAFQVWGSNCSNVTYEDGCPIQCEELFFCSKFMHST